MNDDCTGDYSLVTNVTDTVNTGCFGFTTNVIAAPILLMAFGTPLVLSNPSLGIFSNCVYTYSVPDCGSNSVVYHFTEEFARDTNSTSNPNGFLYSAASAQVRILRPKMA